MNYTTLLTNLENGVYTITVNRPEKLNALNKDVFNELDNAMDEVQQNEEIKTVILTGAGPKAFVAGADITEFAGLDQAAAMALAKKGQDVFFKIERSKKPVVAAVNGFALGGGCELAMACHFRLCSDNAKFGQPEVNLGLIPGYGGTQRLTQLVGRAKSLEMQMTGGIINAPEALQWGLVNYITSPEELLAKTKEIMVTIQGKAPFAVGNIIACVNASMDNSINGFDKEVTAFGECFVTDDMKEGTTAFLEKRKAVFTGK